jgi:DNA invertase Pin-like site-specific DNA recombinase
MLRLLQHSNTSKGAGGVARPKAVGYIRVSTTEQVSGFGLDVQEEAIRAYCKATGLHLIEVLRDEGQSGSNGLETRVGLAEALAKLKAGDAGALVVYRLDRLARDLILQETLVQRLREQGTPVTSASEPDLDTDTDDPTKVLIRQIVGAVSQYERAVIRGRMMAGKAAKAAQGGYLGGRIPYGFRLEKGEIVSDDAEQIVVTLVGSLSAAGTSLREIAAHLDAKGFRPREGDRWHPNTIRRIAALSPTPTSSPISIQR